VPETTPTRDLSTLPKAHLHLHFEAAARPSTLVELADRYGVPAPELTGFTTFTEFSRMYQAAVNVLQTYDDLARLVREMAEDAAAFGCRWIEPGFWPPLHRERLGPDDAQLEVLTAAAEEATRATGVGVGFMIAIDRTRGPELAEQMADLAVRWAGRGVTSLGLHNDENGFPPQLFADSFAKAKAAGLLSTPHAGELDAAYTVAESIDLLRADRVLHGVRVLEDPALTERLANSDVCLDVCPTSNVLLKIVPDFDHHPLRRLLDAGVDVTINADDPTLFQCDLTGEYQLCRDRFGLSDAEVAAIATTSLRKSGASDGLKAAAIADVAVWLAAEPA